MSPLPTVAVAMPAYNEADGIGGFISELDAELTLLASHHTFVVADDCSTDETLDIVTELSEALSGSLDPLPGKSNSGHGPTVLRAYRHSVALKTDVVIQVDGDGQFFAEDLNRLFSEYQSGADVVTGNRVTRVDPGHRLVLSAAVRWLIKISFGVNRHDANCPFRLYRASVLEQLLPRLPDNALVPHLELAVLESRAGVVMSEVDVRHRDRRGSGQGTMWRGRTRWSGFIRLARFCVRALNELIRFWGSNRR